MRFTYNRPVHPLSCVINSRIQFWLKVTVCVAHYRMARAELDSPGNSVVTKWASCLQVKTGGGAFLKCLLQFQYYYKQVLLFSVLFKERVIYTSVESSNSNSGTWVSSVRYWYRTKQVNRLTTWTVLIMLGVFFFFFASCGIGLCYQLLRGIFGLSLRLMWVLLATCLLVEELQFHSLECVLLCLDTDTPVHLQYCRTLTYNLQ